MSRPSLPFAAFCACSLIWGSTFLFIRIGNDALPALWACSLRLMLACVLLNGILFATGNRWPKGEALQAAVLYGVFEFAISFPLLYWGERILPSGLAAVVYAICPVVAIITARFMGMEQLNAARLGAAVLAFGGVALIFWRELIHGGSATGILCVFAAAIAAPIAGLFLQRAPKQNAIGANAVGVSIAIPFAIIASFAMGEPHPMPTTAAQILPIIYLAVMGSVGAFVLFAWLINHWRATSAAFIGVIVPVNAVILGALVRHEAFAPASLVGAAIVIVGVTFALRGGKAAHTDAEPHEELVVLEGEPAAVGESGVGR